ncbi:MAG: RNA-binding domain-containing protein, partial [Venatoribacter sp.]
MLVESQTLEFKQLWKDDYLKTICAFANGKGGQLFIGVNDEGEITGINNCKQLLETLPNKINNKLGLLVDVIPHTKDHKEYIEINVLGTLNIIDYCTQAGLPKPEFAYSWGAVRTTFYKKAVAADQVTPQVTGQVTEEMIKLVKSINGEATRME